MSWQFVVRDVGSENTQLTRALHAYADTPHRKTQPNTRQPPPDSLNALCVKHWLSLVWRLVGKPNVALLGLEDARLVHLLLSGVCVEVAAGFTQENMRWCEVTKSRCADSRPETTAFERRTTRTFSILSVTGRGLAAVTAAAISALRVGDDGGST